MNEEPAELVSHQDWYCIYEGLRQYANFKLKKLKWNFGNRISPEDVANDSIVSLLEGRRKWNSSRVDIHCFLRGVVDSKVSHMASSAENRLFISLDSFVQSDKEEEDPSESIFIDQWPDLQDNSPESLLLEKERQETERSILSQIESAISDEPELKMVLDCLYRGICKASEISKETCIPIERVYELHRKLKNKSKKIADQYFIEENPEQEVLEVD